MHEAHEILKSIWVCNLCEKLRNVDHIEGLINRLHVQHDRENLIMLTNPLINHHGQCVSIPDGEIEAKELQRNMNLECKRGLKRPRQVYNETSALITEKFQDDDDLQDSVELSFPDYKRARRALFRFAEQGIIPIDNPRHIPDPLRLTLRGRNAAPASRYSAERWLLYEAPDHQPLMLIFASDLDLQTLHQSHLWIGDGTFDVSNLSFASTEIF